MNKYIEDYYPKAATMTDWVYLSQLVQADAYYHAVAAHRTNKPFCMGTLFWQFNDCYPSASWSVLNYNHSSKAAAYTIQKVFKPVQAFARIRGDSLSITVVSDLLKPVTNELIIKIITIDGNVLFQKTIAAELGANSVQVIFNEPLNRLCGSNNRDNLYVQYSFGKTKTDLPFVLLLGDIKKATLPRPTFEAKLTQ
ncbi:MAG: hypothetical protein IPO27_13850 [Bacteroidetes bacterium]|nr:hypothetical protein [Bacteroidota bacterium]